MSNWLIEQWNQVKGNVKFSLLSFVGVAIVSGVTALTHGLALWQQVGLVGAFVCLFGWGLIGTWTARARLKKPAVSGQIAPPSVGLIPAVSTFAASPPSDRTELEIRFGGARSGQSTFPFYRIGIYNRGTQVARGVEVFLESISGHHDVTFQEPLPQRLKTQEGKERRCDINPDREELFEFITSSIGGKEGSAFRGQAK